MIERDRLMDSLRACKHVKGFSCDTDCYFYYNGAYVNCIEALLENVHEYIGDLEDAKKERDQLAEENQNLLKRLPKWIRAEDEKPPYNTEVKVWTKEGREFIAVYTYSKEWITEYFFDLTNMVTHWMPLDEAPTAGASPRPTETQPELCIVKCKDCLYYKKKHVLLPDGTERDYTEEELHGLGVSAEIGINVGGQCLYDAFKGYEEDKTVFRREEDFCSRGIRRDEENA